MRWQIACLTLALAGIAWTAVGEETPTTECRPELLAPVNVLDAESAGPCCRQAIEDRYDCEAEEQASECRPELLSPVNVLDGETAAPCCRQGLNNCGMRNPFAYPRKPLRILESIEPVKQADDPSEYALLKAACFLGEKVENNPELKAVKLFEVQPPAEKPQCEWTNAQREGPSIDAVMFTVPVGR